MCLKSSKSKNSTATRSRLRRACAIAWLMRSRKSRRFGKPVSASCCAMWWMRASARLRSLMSRLIADAPTIFPAASLIGEMVSETLMRRPSLHIRSVS